MLTLKQPFIKVKNEQKKQEGINPEKLKATKMAILRKGQIFISWVVNMDFANNEGLSFITQKWRERQRGLIIISINVIANVSTQN